MNLPDFSVRRPITIVMCVFAVILLGFIACIKLPQELFPPITFPQISVVTFYGNAAPEEIETLITRPIEEAVGSVAGLKHIYSRSREGMSIVTIAFDWNMKIDFAALGVREKIDLVKERLPAEAEDPLVVKFNPLERPIVMLSITGGENLMDLREICDTVLKDNLEKVTGVASATVSGGLEREIVVDISQARMTAAGVSILSVVDSITEANVNYPAGTIKKGLYEYLIRTVGEFRSVDEINYVVVTVDDQSKLRDDSLRKQYVEKQESEPRESVDSKRAQDVKGRVNKRLIMLKEIATVKDTVQERTSISRFNGKENVSIAIQKQAGYNTIKVVEAVLAKMEQLKAKELPANVKVEIIYDHSIFIKNSIKGITDEGLQGGALAFLTLLLFLRNFMAALVVTLAIPIAVMSTFFFMFCMGLTLNMMTLGGLALGIGMMVDNAIVVIENIFRYRQLGIGNKAAAIVATNEVMSAIFSSTLTQVAVFLPLLLFVPGVSGQLFKELSWTVIFSHVGAFMMSITLVPLMAVNIKLKHVSNEEIERRKDMKTFFGDMLPAKRRSIMATVLGSVGILVLLTSFMIKSLDMELLPKMDQGQFIIDVSYPTGTVLDVTHAMADKVEQVCLTHSDIVESTAVSVGAGKSAGGGASLAGPHQGQVLVTLKRERKITSQEFVDQLRSEMDAIKDSKVKIEFILQESEFQFLATGGMPIVVQIRGYDNVIMDHLVNKIQKRLAEIPGVFDVKDDRSESFPETKVMINKEKTALNAISVNDIAMTAKMALDGTIATTLKEKGKEVPIRVQLCEEDRKDFMSLGNLLIRSTLLNSVIPLKEVSKVVKGLGPSEIKRIDQDRATLVMANIERGFNKAEVMSQVQAIIDDVDGEQPEFRIKMAGETEEMAESNRKFMFAIILSIVLVYMIMASQFESLLQPFIVMFTVPLSVIGMSTALFITHTAISAIVLLGVIMLGGVVVNNGIVLLEYVNLLRESGEDCVNAAEKASRIRMRPILMSAFATIVGLLPLALGLGEGAELRSPMAITVIGGLLSSTIFTLVVVPMVYVVAEEIRQKFGSKKKTFSIQEPSA